MNSRQTKTSIANFALLLLLVAGTILVLPASCRVGRHPGMSEHISNVKQIKLILDSFAMDNDGVYPTEATAKFYDLPKPSSSNDYFHQLFASGNVNSEQIFWVRNSKVCNPQRPDDITTANGEFSAAETLQPGDNHWAYIDAQENTGLPRHPLIVESYLPGTTTFDKELRDGTAIILRIDGSAKPERLNRASIILDGDGNNLLGPAAEVWAGTTPDIRQPDPAP